MRIDNAKNINRFIGARRTSKCPNLICNFSILTFIFIKIKLYDEFPADLFAAYDIPLDIIVTPTQVIRVAKPPTRPEGILWHLLSQRRLDIVNILKAIKETEEKYVLCKRNNMYT